MSISQHYDAAYFATHLQHDWAAFSVAANLWLIGPHVKGETVLDFGCAGGHLLDLLPGKVKIGVDINPAARTFAAGKGYQVHERISEVPDGSVDTIVSSHALEHVPCPYNVLCEMREKLRPGGKLVLLVPFERWTMPWRPGDKDQHLYTWSPLNLGNLVAACGFDVETCRRIAFRTPPKGHLVRKAVNAPVYHALSRLAGWLMPKLTQVQLVARRP